MVFNSLQTLLIHVKMLSIEESNSNQAVVRICVHRISGFCSYFLDITDDVYKGCLGSSAELAQVVKTLFVEIGPCPHGLERIGLRRFQVLRGFLTFFGVADRSQGHNGFRCCKMPRFNRLARAQPFIGPEVIGNQLLDSQERELDILWRIASCCLDHGVQIRLCDQEEVSGRIKTLGDDEGRILKSPTHTLIISSDERSLCEKVV